MRKIFAVLGFFIFSYFVAKAQHEDTILMARNTDLLKNLLRREGNIHPFLVSSQSILQTTYKHSSFARYGGQVGRFEDKFEWEIWCGHLGSSHVRQMNRALRFLNWVDSARRPYLSKIAPAILIPTFRPLDFQTLLFPISPSSLSVKSMRLLLRNLFVLFVRLIGGRIRDVLTGEVIDRGLVLWFRGNMHVLGASRALVPVIARQKRMCYWHQSIGFTVHPKPYCRKAGPWPLSGSFIFSRLCCCWWCKKSNCFVWHCFLWLRSL